MAALGSASRARFEDPEPRRLRDPVQALQAVGWCGGFPLEERGGGGGVILSALGLYPGGTGWHLRPCHSQSPCRS